jgi:hypothetical protein
LHKNRSLYYLNKEIFVIIIIIIKDKGHWYEHVPQSAETSQEEKVTILWNQEVQTDRTILKN